MFFPRRGVVARGRTPPVQTFVNAGTKGDETGALHWKWVSGRTANKRKDPAFAKPPGRQTASDGRDLSAEQDRIRAQTGGGRDLVVKETSELWDEGAMLHKGMQRRRERERGSGGERRTESWKNGNTRLTLCCGPKIYERNTERIGDFAPSPLF